MNLFYEYFRSILEILTEYHDLHKLLVLMYDLKSVS